MKLGPPPFIRPTKPTEPTMSASPSGKPPTFQPLLYRAATGMERGKLMKRSGTGNRVNSSEHYLRFSAQHVDYFQRSDEVTGSRYRRRARHGNQGRSSEGRADFFPLADGQRKVHIRKKIDEGALPGIDA